MKRCLDLDLQQPNPEKSPLSNHPAYLTLRKQSGGHDDLFVYGDLLAVSRLLRSVSSSGQGISKQPAWPAEGDFRHGGLFCGPQTGRLLCTAILLAPSGEADAGRPPPVVDAALAALPADLLLHYWSNLLDLPRIVAAVEHIPQLRDPLATSEKFVRKTGMSFPDFFSLFDRQFSLTVTGMRGNGFFPSRPPSAACTSRARPSTCPRSPPA